VTRPAGAAPTADHGVPATAGIPSRPAGPPEAPGRPESASAITFVGAEMRGGSDGPGLVPAAALEFIDTLPSGARILLAGPHEDAIAERLADLGYSVDVLLRAIDDADAARNRLPGSVGVLCGSVVRLRDTYDAVIALGGLDRVASADAPAADWSAALEALTARVAPAGRLAVVVRNGLGIDHLTTVGWTAGNRADAYAASRPAFADRVAAAGLTRSTEVALYPNVSTPSVFVATPAFAEPVDVVATAVAGAYRSTVGAADTLIDPRRLARDAVAHHLGPDLAPGWLLVAHRGDTPAPASADVIVTDARTAYAPVPQRLRRTTDGRWTRSRLNPTASTTALATAPASDAHGDVVRTPERLDGDVPAGPLLEEEMIAAAGAHDALTLRQLVDAYARWLGVRTSWLAETQATGLPRPDSMMRDRGMEVESGPLPYRPDRVFAVADNVVHTDDTFTPLDPSWTMNGDVDAETAFLASLVRFAERLLASALPHPWTTAQSPARLAARLASMAGLEARADLVAAATVLADRMGSVLDPAPPPAPAIDRAQVAPATWPIEGVELVTGVRGLAGPVDPATPLATPRGLAEATRTIEELSYELAAAREQLGLLAGTLRDRDKRLAKANKQLAVIKRSQAFRLATMARRPAKAVLKALGRDRRKAAR
jgi:hypothetical protein